MQLNDSSKDQTRKIKTMKQGTWIFSLRNMVQLSFLCGAAVDWPIAEEEGIINIPLIN